MEMIPNENLPRVAKCEPQMIKVEPGKIYAWCTCGLSEKQPFCDGSHKKIETSVNAAGELVVPFKSLKIEFDKEEEIWFCQCKQTKTPPFCDGTHNHLTL